jgi:hypothetical protein
MAFVNSQGPLPGMDFSVPDVYLQATPVGPIPIPFFSICLRLMKIPICLRFLLMCMPGHNLMNMAPASLSGPGPGAASGMVCSATRNVKGSCKFFVQGAPATRALMDPTLQNGMSPNSVGTTLVPSQIRLVNPSA